MIHMIERLRQANWVRRLHASRWSAIASPLIHAGNVVFRRLAVGMARGGVEWITPTGVVVRLDADYYLNHRHLPDADPMLLCFLSTLRPAKQIVYDVGSYIGMYAVLTAMQEPTCHVIAFEMSPTSQRLIRRHIALNNVEQQVKVISAAVGKESGFVTFEDAPYSPENSIRPDQSRTAGDPAAKLVTVPMISLDDFACASGHIPSVIKIDVEGAELDVLLGARRLLAQHRPVIFCEIHRFAWSRFGVTPDSFRAFLDDVDYTATLLNSDERVWEFPQYGQCRLVPAP